MTNLPLWDDSDFTPKPPASMLALRREALACTKCRLSQTRTQVVWGNGDFRSALMMVGMGPSVLDDQKDKVYSGIAGSVLDRMLREAGFDRSKTYLTNLHKCVAKDKSDPNNIRPPTKAELKACREWLDGEFAFVKPKILVCIGSPAAKALLNEDFDLDSQRGEWIENNLGYRALATYQPTYITRLERYDPERATELYALTVGDFRKAALEAGILSEA